MRPSLSLQRSLYRHQHRQIRSTVAGASASFRRYEAEYEKATRTFQRETTLDAVDERVAKADLVYVGDYHTLKAAQTGYLRLAQRALTSKRRVVLALEFVEARHQKLLERFLRGELSEGAFLMRIGHPYRGEFDIWPHFRPIFELAKAHQLEMVAIDRRATGPRSLALRDEAAAEAIAQVARAPDRPLVLVLVGQFHIAPSHLPARVRAALGEARREHLLVYQNADGVYWRLAARGLAGHVDAVELGPDAFALVSASPVVCQRSFLDYVEAERGDAPLDETGLPETFKRLAREIGRVVGVDVRRELPKVGVVTADDLDAFEQLTRRARFSPSERSHLKKHLLTRESAYVPRAKVAWLASLSLNHAAEEAAHFVRHVAAGEAMGKTRLRGEAFWARCLEEALGFFGSKLVNPTRTCTPLDEWVRLFREGSREDRRTAAFVLALSAADRGAPGAAAMLLPLSPLPLFHAVSHALGYLLGEALFRAFEAGAVDRATIKRLFVDPFDDPARTYFELEASLRTGAPAPRPLRPAPPRAAPRARSAA